MKRVALLTTFRGFDRSYSLCIVAADQLNMLTAAGYTPRVFVTENFKKEDIFAHPQVDVFELPDQKRSNFVMVDDTFDEDVQKLVEKMRDGLKDIDVVITHDIVYQPADLKHNLAARIIAKERPDIVWLHWIHSATSPYDLIQMRPIFKDRYSDVIATIFPNSYYVFFNHWSIPRIAHNFRVPEYRVRVVHHPTDYATYADFHDITKRLVEKYSLLDAQYMAVYPIRLDNGKQVEVVIKTMGALKKMGHTVRCVIPDFHSSSDDPKDPKFRYRQFLKETATGWGLSPQDCIFLSEFSPETKVSSPRKVISDLFDLSNIFIMPSRSESYSLITQEAAMRGNLLVLNEDFPPFRDIFGGDAIFAKFSSEVDILTGMDGQTNTRYDAGEEGFFLSLAAMLKARLDTPQERTRRKLLRERTPGYVFRNELEPLLHISP